MSIFGDLQTQAGGAWVELFELDLTAKGGDLYRFAAETNEHIQPIVWRGQVYNPLPVEITGYETDGQGRLARPTAKLANVGGIFSALVDAYDDLLGVSLTRYRTETKYMDAVNFVSGVNPTADPAEYLPPDVYYISRKVRENPDIIEFELVSPLELEGQKLPARIMQADNCWWLYRGDGCDYNGPPVANVYDKPVTELALDDCSHSITGCKLRHPPPMELPFGAFPACNKIPRI